MSADCLLTKRAMVLVLFLLEDFLVVWEKASEGFCHVLRTILALLITLFFLRYSLSGEALLKV